MDADGEAGAVRVDRWLWAVRAFRSRSLAAAACHGGKVEVNGTRAKPHKHLRPGDVVDFSTPARRWRWRVVATAERRGPAPVARTLYEDLTPPEPPRPVEADVGVRARGRGRPTKRERRQIDRRRRF